MIKATPVGPSPLHRLDIDHIPRTMGQVFRASYQSCYTIKTLEEFHLSPSALPSGLQRDAEARFPALFIVLNSH